MTKGEKIIIYTDGGSRNNPGPSGIGVVIGKEDGTVIKEISKFLGKQTNNLAEYEAIITGLEEVKKMLGKERAREIAIEVRADSELAVRQLSGLYQIKEETLFPQFIKIWNLRVTYFPHLTFTHVRREHNKHADALANEAIDSADSTSSPQANSPQVDAGSTKSKSHNAKLDF